MEEEKIKYKIGWIGGLLVISIAIVADLLQVILDLTIVLSPASDFVTLFAEVLIFIYFLFRRVRFIRGKFAATRFVVFFFTTILESVWILNALPTLTLDTIFNIHSTRKEDRGKFKIAQEKKGSDRKAKIAAEQSRQQAFQIRQLRLRAANDNQAQMQAANDNEPYEEAREAA